MHTLIVVVAIVAVLALCAAVVQFASRPPKDGGRWDRDDFDEDWDDSDR
ncbi:hypothetical protein ACLMAJ_29985 [Nocardia sp. KC 131]